MVESGNLLVFFLTATAAQSGGIMTGVGAGSKGGRERERGRGLSCDMRLRLGIPEAAAHCVATIHQKENGPREERGSGSVGGRAVVDDD